ncbi:MAG: DUF2878 domain-containing protein [Xanthomonadales bacterium]|nr:DUF2878 domain-containing protein [Gammaproteobacteria bacterium]MBT8052947.1 DUF2878 domain-containing protein [Gammaproteobacteria bacterium]NND57839.1 DUF2878 domain-containing protein [Xanthomonadales bacterium]NNK50718.1 DUF2878 domain-containing protein [Xanthomonadales bacterium]
MKHLLVNFAAFQAGWFSCVLGAANGFPWIGPLAVLAAVGLHLSIARRPLAELQLVLCAVAIGLVADSLLVFAGWVSYPNGIWAAGFAPYWILAMWALFATTLNVSMKWMRNRVLVAVLAGAAGGPLSYLAGERLGAMQFVEPVNALVALTVIWAVAMPALVWLAIRLDGFSESRPSTQPREECEASQHA